MSISVRSNRNWMALAGRLLVLMLCFSVHPASARLPACPVIWPQWETFKTNLVRDGGHVIANNESPEQQTNSEGQAYALFFALVANDRKSFDAILQWTENNLAQGDLTSHLPAWLWGRKKDGTWGVLDANPATDADLWLVYTLGEAGRLWHDRRFIALSSLLANRILREESADLPGLGLSLLPGKQGFQQNAHIWRLNPSYLPMQVLDWLAHRSENLAWRNIDRTSLQTLIASAPKGFAPDWVDYDVNGGFLLQPSATHPIVGSYNAIRVYLWLGMLARQTPEKAELLKTFAPMAEFVRQHGFPPESINILDGSYEQPGPSGFSAALLPFLEAEKTATAVQEQTERLNARPVRADAYYEQALSLFALGWQAHRFRFSVDGDLLPCWFKS